MAHAVMLRRNMTLDFFVQRNKFCLAPPGRAVKISIQTANSPGKGNPMINNLEHFQKLGKENAEATVASVANFLRRSTLLRGPPRIIPAIRERPKGTFPSCCPENLSRSSRRGLLRNLRFPPITRLMARRLQLSLHPLRDMNQARTNRAPLWWKEPNRQRMIILTSSRQSTSPLRPHRVSPSRRVTILYLELHTAPPHRQG